MSEQQQPPGAHETRTPTVTPTGFLRNLRIGNKLLLGFGAVIFLLVLVVVAVLQGSAQATVNINRTEDLRVPIALRAVSAQTNLLRMLASTRGYLALGDQQFIGEYDAAEQAFAHDLAELQAQSDELDDLTLLRVTTLQEDFEAWQELPPQLFALRDDRLLSEPAYRILATDGTQYGGQVLIDTGRLITEQSGRAPTQENIRLLADMATYQGSFAAMLGGLRNYVNTQNRIFRQEYEANLLVNTPVWANLQDAAANGRLNEAQIAQLDSIAENRACFLMLVDSVSDSIARTCPVSFDEETIFAILESEDSRLDLFLFQEEAVPLNDKMLSVLNDLVTDQETLLRRDLNEGRVNLNRTVERTLIVGSIAAVAGVILAYLINSAIAGPVGRLTEVAEEIRGGQLEAVARVESSDEVGILARTFNSMTRRLRDTLVQVQREKQRADSLLDVVIPIGVELASEKDFNRLLEGMLVEAKEFCHADVGILYLHEIGGGGDELQYVIVRNDAENIAYGGTTGNKVPYKDLSLRKDEGSRPHVAVHVAHNNVTVNVADSHNNDAFDFSSPDGQSDHYAQSYLSIPLRNSENRVIGVLQLMDPRNAETHEIVPFDANLQQMMESFSSLAVAALEAYIREQALRMEIRQLRIEIDEAKKQQQVKEIVETDFFKELRSKARDMRTRSRETRKKNE